MDIIKCPKCKKDVQIDISKSISEDGEVYRCPYCLFDFRYVTE